MDPFKTKVTEDDNLDLRMNKLIKERNEVEIEIIRKSGQLEQSRNRLKKIESELGEIQVIKSMGVRIHRGAENHTNWGMK